MNILLWSDDAKVYRELLAKAAELKGDGKIHAVDLGEGHDAKGADTLHQIPLSEEQRADDPTVLAALKHVADQTEPELILLPATKRGKALGAQAAETLDAQFASEASDLGADEGRLWAQRLVLSGQSVAKLRFQGRLVVTVGPKSFDPLEGGSDPETKDEDFSPPEPKLKLLGTAGKGDEGFNLAEAEIVVGVGRGFKKEEDLKMADELAKVLGGAVGCSRPIAADLKWLGEEHWIGLSGHEIKPQLYLAAGVSGQIQHMAGCRDAKLLVAINNNEDAPIFQQCDYGIVGDLYKVLPKLTELIKTKYR